MLDFLGSLFDGVLIHPRQFSNSHRVSAITTNPFIAYQMMSNFLTFSPSTLIPVVLSSCQWCHMSPTSQTLGEATH
jgi:hypothetical protein